MAKMIDYCKQDVKLLEQVHKELRSHDTPKTHYGVLYNGDKRTCPECGSNNVIISKTKITAAGTKQTQYQCKDCGKYHSK